MIINGVNTEDITFVVQGVVIPNITKKTLKSIRKTFPGSKIILSTWEKTKTKDLDFDEVVLSQDCGAVICDFHGVPNNTNRQCLSSQEGLKRVKTKYAAKVRGDLFFETPNFLQYFNAFPCYDEKYKRVKSRMIVLSLYTRYFYINYEHWNINHSAFHISDWFLFGYTEDVLKYYSSSLIMNLAEFSRYYLDKPEVHQYLPYPHLMLKLTPEQYFGTQFFGRKDDDILKLSNYDMNENKKYLFNNFIILNYEKSRIFNLKWEERSRNEWSMHPFEVSSLIFYSEFQYYYKKICDPEYNFPIKDYKEVKKRKLKVLWNYLWMEPFKRYIKKYLNKLYSKIKKGMRFVMPAYRVGNDMRNQINELSSEEKERFNYLNYRIDNLTKLMRAKEP